MCSHLGIKYRLHKISVVCIKISAFVLVLIVNVKQTLMQMPRVLVDESNDFKPSDLETGSKCEQLFEKSIVAK